MSIPEDLFVSLEPESPISSSVHDLALITTAQEKKSLKSGLA